MRYGVYVQDLLYHDYLINSFNTLEQAREFFIAESHSPASFYDDLLVLAVLDDNDCYVDSISDYQFTRLDRDDRE